MGVLPALVLGGLGAWHYLRPLYQKTPEPPASGAPSSSSWVAAGNGTAATGAVPEPNPQLPGQPIEPLRARKSGPPRHRPRSRRPLRLPPLRRRAGPKAPVEVAATPEVTSLAAVKMLYLRPANPIWTTSCARS